METETVESDSSDSIELGRIQDYILRSELSGGGGSQSRVWRAEHRASGKIVALKKIQLSKLTRSLKNCLDCEINFLSSVNHPNIIRLLDVFEAEGSVFLILEFCAGGNLATYIRNHGRVQECIAKRFMQQIAAGLEVLHSHLIIHRDVKPENILLSSSESDPVLKIADFGLSRILHRNDFAETVCGSPLYMAPEILQFQRYDEKVDMWSVGAILFELLNGYPPFYGRTSVQLLQNIKKCSYLPFSEPVLSELHLDCIDLCSRLLSVNPANRLTFDEFYQHDFLKIQKMQREKPAMRLLFNQCKKPRNSTAFLLSVDHLQIYCHHAFPVNTSMISRVQAFFDNLKIEFQSATRQLNGNLSFPMILMIWVNGLLLASKMRIKKFLSFQWITRKRRIGQLVNGLNPPIQSVDSYSCPEGQNFLHGSFKKLCKVGKNYSII